MTRWFTSDQHWGHQNIIGFCSRPFLDVDDMQAQLIRRWNAVVKPEDTVWVLGDWAMGRLAATLPIGHQLNGRKLLVAGNHDRCWEGHGTAFEEWARLYRNEGAFARVFQGPMETTLANGTSVLLSHFPYRGDSHDSDRFQPWRPLDDGRWLLHGHVHTSWQRDGHQINVGVDVWNYRPVSEATLIELIEQAEAEAA